jgi:YVTN family beta-propeller protein
MTPNLGGAGRLRRKVLTVTVAATLVAVATVPTAFGQQYLPAFISTQRDVPLPGDTSRFDYQSLDLQAHLLYIAHLGASTIPVYDTLAGKVVGEVKDVPGVHGILAIPELGRVYATATDVNQVAVIDPQTLAVVAMIPGGDYPDGLAYNPTVGKLYVSDQRGSTSTVIDAQQNKVVATVALGGEAGNTQFDPLSQQMYVAVQTRNQVVTIDPQSDRVVARFDTPGCDHPHGLQISPDRRLAFVACEGNNKLAVLDLQSNTVTELHDVGAGPDVIAFDPILHVLWVAAESGPLTAFFETDTGLRLLAQRDVGPNAHSVVVNPENSHVYVPLANFGGQPVLRELAAVSSAANDDGD